MKEQVLPVGFEPTNQHFTLGSGGGIGEEAKWQTSLKSQNRQCGVSILMLPQVNIH